MRELGPTVDVWRGTEPPSLLPSDLHDLNSVNFTDDKGGSITIADWQKTTYTDGLPGRIETEVTGGKIVVRNWPAETNDVVVTEFQQQPVCAGLAALAYY